MSLLTSSARASEPDDFQALLQRTETPASAHLPPGDALTADKAHALWQGLLGTPTTQRTFAPRLVLARLLREALTVAHPLQYSELLTRTQRFIYLAVVRPDGYAVGALSGRPLSHLSRPILRRGELYAQGMRVGAFYFNNGGVFFAVDEALQQQGNPVGELPLGRDPLTAALLGAEDALGEMVRAMAHLLTEPVRTLEGLTQLPSAVAGLIASSPEYFARYGAMNLEDQVREAARLSLHILTLQGGAAAAGPRLASASRLPVLGLSARGSLVVRELALPAGAVTAVVGAGAASASIVLMAQHGPTRSSAVPTSWPPPPEGPGQWTPKTESMPGESQRYQSQLTGAPEGWVYRVRTGPGPRDFVDFDGFSNGVLLEVKGSGYLEFLRKMDGQEWFKGTTDMLSQAKRHLDAARGTPIHWHFAEKEVADAIRALFARRGLGRIKVEHTPLRPEAPSP